MPRDARILVRRSMYPPALETMSNMDTKWSCIFQSWSMLSISGRNPIEISPSKQPSPNISSGDSLYWSSASTNGSKSPIVNPEELQSMMDR